MEFVSLEHPPVKVDCKYQIRWMENFCPANNQGTEWDWMGFLYDVNTAPVSSRSTIDDLGAIYVALCGGDHCDPNLDQGHWSTLRRRSASVAKVYVHSCPSRARRRSLQVQRRLPARPDVRR